MGLKQIIQDKKWMRILVGFLIVAVSVVAIIAVDQVTKQLVHDKIRYGSSIVLIPGLLELSHVHNTGAAWGVLSSHTGLLSVITLLSCAVLCFLLYESKKRSLQVALTLVIGGALGNLIDRVFRGYVIDFIKVWIVKYEFPNFNFADSCITIGCVLMVIAVLFSGRKTDDTLFREDSVISKLFNRKKPAEVPSDETE